MTTSFDKFAEEYDKLNGDIGDYTHQKIIDPALFKAAGSLKNKKIYDIACGNGYLPRKYIKMGAKEVWASDISPKLVEIAKTRYDQMGIKYFVQDATDFTSIPKNYFDLVTVNMAIHYVKDLNKFFRGVSNALKINGSLVFTADHPLKNLAYYDLGKNSINEVLKEDRLYIKQHIGSISNPWLGGNKRVKHYLRPLSYFLETLAKNNLLVDKIVEPATDRLDNYLVKNPKVLRTDIPSKMAINAIKVK